MEFKEVFRRISEVLEASAVPYMLTGSFAMSYQGVMRATHDVDIVISAPAQKVVDLVRHLNDNGYYADQQGALDAHREISMFNAIDNETGWKIDFIFSKPTAYAREAFQRRKTVDFHGARMFVSSVEDVVVSKLDWAKMGESARQIEDVSAVLKKKHAVLDRPYVEKWIKELGLSVQWDRARQLAGIE
jgi:hypothetical protein